MKDVKTMGNFFLLLLTRDYRLLRYGDFEGAFLN